MRVADKDFDHGLVVGRILRGDECPKDSPVNGTSATVFRLTDCS